MNILFEEKEINRKVLNLAQKISKDYRDKQVVLIYIEKGGKTFFEKLASNLDIDFEWDSVRVKSYLGTQSCELKWIKKPTVDLKGKTCLLVDDILDTGQTIKRVRKFILDSGAKECKICVAVNKHAQRVEDIHPDCYLFDAENEFLVGFGMDYNGKYRELPAIYVI